jgi:CAAD domains of cyanobacterial aminoacyl-tRNA synthetase
MDNILVELERIDHIAEEAAAKPHLDNPIEIPAKPERDSLMTSELLAKIESDDSIEVLTKPELDDKMKIDLPATESAVATEVTPENLAIDASDLAEKSADKLSDLSSYISQVYQNNRGAFIAVGLFFAALVTLKLMLAIVSAVNSIPLFAPFFQTIGLGYTGWFVYRYLLHASTRQELGEEITKLKLKVMGKSAA